MNPTSSYALKGTSETRTFSASTGTASAGGCVRGVGLAPWTRHAATPTIAAQKAMTAMRFFIGGIPLVHRFSPDCPVRAHQGGDGRRLSGAEYSRQISCNCSPRPGERVAGAFG
jgi:hypothetical protein